VIGGDRALGDEPAAPEPIGRDATPRVAREIPLAATAAHVYTECARIWNPIHTDPEVAKRAGLPRIILHGTATLALAISAGMRRAGPAGPRITRIAGRFTGMVPLPSRLRVQGRRDAGTPGVLRFRATTPDGTLALDGGYLETP